MRNVTISLSDDVARWARIWAAEHDTSISAMLARLLREKMEQESRYGEAMKEFLSIEVREISDGSGYPARESLHKR